ncbi:hypothetical protein [Rhizorhabdus phycosphaerae]|uniref:hypothetical protein n=1 Tax=Rhizorhabdus phycosphaerae TaxID=2711156 RepID=UPI0013E9AB03|nr:hypothetical protein [Rhizorhabdus phycosphaerae]
MTRFRWITQCRALDVLEVFRTNAQFHRLFEEFGLGEDLDAEGGVGLTTPKLHSLLQRLLRRDPDRRDADGNHVSDSLVREAARHLPNLPDGDGYPWETKRRFEKSEATALRNSLAVDGWTVVDKVLVPVSPVPLSEPRSRLRESLDGPLFGDARKRLDQLEAALDGGNWEAANGVARGFLAALFVAICQTLEQGAAPREESDARKHLADMGFFGPTRQQGKPSPEAEFVWKMSGMMGTEGVHAGETTPDTAVYRYALTLLTADYFLGRLKAL